MEFFIFLLAVTGISYLAYRVLEKKPGAMGNIFGMSAPSKKVKKPLEGHTNIRRISSEKKEPTNSGNFHSFPEMEASVTQYENFCRTLFVLKTPEIGQSPKWNETIGNDYPTILEGSETWAITEMRKRLRPHRPVIFDPFGFWEETSKKLEMDPFYEDNITRAFLKIREADRPCVITLNPKDGRKDKTHSKQNSFILYRYGFEDFVFHSRYLQDAPEEILYYLMLYLGSKPEIWETLSPARIRQQVLKKIRDDDEKERAEMSVMEAYRQEREEEKYNNRFAALWELREEQQPKKELETSDGDGK